MAKTQGDAAEPAEPAGEAEEIDRLDVAADPLPATTQAEPAAQAAPAPVVHNPPETTMPLVVCSTCKGVGCVRHGGRIYQCPSCHGARGRPLGQRLQDDTALATRVPPGASRAGAHLARGIPDSVRIRRR